MIIIAENWEINGAAEAMRAGAKDCLFRPFSAERLAQSIGAAFSGLHPNMQLGAEGRDQPRRNRSDSAFHGMIGASPLMQSLFARVSAVAPSKAPIMIQGDVGTGKSTLARVIHDASGAAGPFVSLDGTCSLFKTASADAEAFLLDRLEQARGGTLFLDRLDELDRDIQTAFVPFVQHHTARGAASDVRFVAALTASPSETVASGRLRSDLFYCLNVVEVSLPPLRLRDGDLAVIAEDRLPAIAEEEQREQVILRDDVLSALENYTWPGNVRELLATLRGLVLTSTGRHVQMSDLPARVLLAQSSRTRPEAQNGHATDPSPAHTTIGPLIGKRLQDIERAVIEATIAAQGGSIPRAARVLDVSPSTIYRKREAWSETS